MSQNQAIVSVILARRGDKISENILVVVLGVTLLSLLAQITVVLPWTPVPITGQTFAVILVSLLWGYKRSFSVVLSYLIIGAMGLPVFAQGKSGLIFGPTFGYLFGMLVASAWVGYLSDKKFLNSFFKTYIAAASGSVIIFSFGLLVLSYFVPSEQLLAAGLIPFLPGDIIKTCLASGIAYKANRISI